MSKLIIVCGLPGSGKTTLAKELSKKLKIACFHKDTLKEELFELFDGKNLEDSMSIGKKTVKLLFRLVEEQLSKGIDVIMESPFNFPEDYQTFTGWKEKYQLDLYSLICLVDKKIRKERFFSRDRHRSHLDGEREANFDDKYDYKDIPGKQIYITTDESADTLAEKVISQLDK